MICIAGNPEINGSGPPIDRMPTDMLERIRKFIETMSREGRNVYLGNSGIPFSGEGYMDNAEGLEVDLSAIEEELGQR